MVTLERIWSEFKVCKDPYYRVLLPRPSLASASTKVELDFLESMPTEVALDIRTDLLDDDRFACLKAIRDLDDQCAFSLLVNWWSIFGIALSAGMVVPVSKLPGDGIAADLHQCSLATVVKRQSVPGGGYEYFNIGAKGVGKHTKIIGIDVENSDYPCKFLRAK